MNITSDAHRSMWNLIVGQLQAHFQPAVTVCQCSRRGAAGIERHPIPLRCNVVHEVVTRVVTEGDDIPL